MKRRQIFVCPANSYYRSLPGKAHSFPSKTFLRLPLEWKRILQLSLARCSTKPKNTIGCESTNLAFASIY